MKKPSSTTANVLILTLCWAACTGVGAYVTFFQQPRQLTQLQEAERVASLKRDEAGALSVQRVSGEATARDVLTRWNARYKVIPDTLRAHDVVAYFNSLTPTGFKAFDVTVKESNATPDYNSHTLTITGRGRFGALYDFVWAVENNRSFYRIKTLNLEQIDLVDEDRKGRQHLEVMVSFSLDVEAYYGGTLGATAPPPGAVAASDAGLLPAPKPGAPPAVPASVLPVRRPARNPFFPLVLETVPPNTYGLLDVEQAQLVSIADGRAIFLDEDGYHTLGLGAEVYLGAIVRVDAERGRVVARLNRGGILDEVERRIEADDFYRPVNADGSPAAAASARPN